MSSRHVLYVVDETLTPGGQGVAATKLPRLRQVLDGVGVDASFALLRGAPRVEAALRSVEATTIVLGASSGAGTPAAALRLRRHVAAVRPDLVQGQGLVPAAVAGLATQGLSIPTVYARSHTSGRRRLRIAAWSTARLCPWTIAPSAAAAHFAVTDDRTPGERVLAVHLGAPAPAPVDARDLAALRSRLGAPVGATIVTVVARLRWEKGVDIAIRSLPHMARLMENPVHLVVVGSGPEEGALRGLAASQEHPVHFVGHQDDPTPWYQLADVVVMPSRREAFGEVAVETMANARPLVATAVGGLVEVVDDGVTGLLVAPEQPKAIAAAVAELLAGGRASTLGMAGRARFEQHFTLEAMAARLCAAWSTILDAQPR